MDATSKEFEDLTRFDLDPEMVRHLPEDLCREKRIVLLGRVPANAREVVPLGMLDVTSDELPMDVERKVPWKVRPVQLTKSPANS